MNLYIHNAYDYSPAVEVKTSQYTLSYTASSQVINQIIQEMETNLRTQGRTILNNHWSSIYTPQGPRTTISVSYY